MTILTQIQQNIQEGKSTLILDTDDNMYMIVSPYTIDGFVGGTGIFATDWEHTVALALDSAYVKLINADYITDLSDSLIIATAFNDPDLEDKSYYYNALKRN